MVLLAAFLLLLTLLLASSAHAQTTETACSTPNPGPLQPASGATLLSSAITVPIIFHIVQNSAGQPAISTTLLQQQVGVLNDRFAGSSLSFRMAGLTITRNDVWHDDVRSASNA